MANIYPGHAHSLNDIDAAQAALSDAGVISAFDMCYDVRSPPIMYSLVVSRLLH
jgi:hypothetical protein